MRLLSQDTRWRYLAFAIVILVIGSTIFFSFNKLFEQKGIIERNNRANIWFLAQVEIEYFRLIESLHRYAMAQAEASHNEIMQRFDIFWSRIPILIQGPQSAQLRQIEGFTETVDGFVAVLEDSEALITKLALGDIVNYEILLGKLRAIQAPLHDLVVNALLKNKKIYSAEKAELYALFDRLAVYLSISIVAGFFGFILFYREVGRARGLLADLHTAQEDLLRQERLATLGQLTATVSHELRNPLGAMRPSLYIIRKRLPLEDIRLQQAIERVERGITRCDHIIDELLDFTRIDTLHRQPISLDIWLGELLDEQTVPEGISLHRKFALPEVMLSIDPDRLRRAVINVYDNACQAMTSEVESRPAHLDACLTVTTQATAGRVELTFIDNGPGIPSDVLPKVFEPLFSTKNFGVGLGLPTVKQIMQQHEGGLEIDTEVGRGTRIVLWLPLSQVMDS